ncbi:hypothetical protein RYX36_005636, partial [Vicia faba]
MIVLDSCSGDLFRDGDEKIKGRSMLRNLSGFVDDEGRKRRCRGPKMNEDGGVQESKDCGEVVKEG